MRIHSSTRIAIIGGGPGGLTLARILQQNGFNPIVYEREPSPEARQQGGTLDLHPESGQRALQAAGLLEAFEAAARFEGQDFRLLDKAGKVYVDDISGPDQKKRPEIDRGTLRRLLLDSIRPDTIQWGHTLASINARGSGQHELIFENGHHDTVDLVVGADGAFSRVRPMVSEAVPAYTGVSMIELMVDSVDERHPDLSRFNGQGSLFAFGDRKAIMAQRNGDGRIRVYLAFQVEQEWLEASGISFDEPEAAREALLDLFADWSVELQNYIRYAEGAVLPRRIYMLPVEHKWTSVPGVTLIGDAAHLMSPFAGKGANMAMLDAAELAGALANQEDLNSAVKSFEEVMFDYASAAARESDFNLKLSFSEDAAREFLAVLEQYQIGVNR